MTWSILARDASGAFGIAIASRFFAVGALCPHAHSGAGALSTQALVNPLYGKPGLALLAEGTPAPEVVRVLVAADDGRDHRQLHVIDAQGRVGAHTGAACIDWCGHLAGPGWSVAGNMLAGPQVLTATAAAYERLATHPFAERLLAALDAGEAAGGDQRGKQAAALLIVTTEDYPALTLRVDDHDEPFLELRRLYEKSLERFVPFASCLPTKTHPAGIIDRARIEAEIERFHAARARREAR
ncbi:MAG: DUF1028 domain-containing protein [Burkholderiales bacterium]|nr:DUF1028 domain-containing protein [Burkholderiales bacterium]